MIWPRIPPRLLIEAKGTSAERVLTWESQLSRLQMPVDVNKEQLDYDAGHSGWNEIHPVRFVQKLTGVVDPRYQGMGKADAALVDAFKKEVLDVWCFRSGESSDPLVVAAQQDPENGWHIHPDIDGCNKEPVIR